MVIITTTEGVAQQGDEARLALQNRRALLPGNFSSNSQFVPGADQSQNTEYLFPDKSISGNKVQIDIPDSYDAVVTKDHVSSGTLIRYDGRVFYSIASVVDYAISKNKTSFSLFLEEGVYKETRTIGDGTISLSFVGASKLNSVISVKGLAGFSGGILNLGDDSLVSNLCLDVDEAVQFFIGSSNTFSRSSISNCLFFYSNSTFDATIIQLKGSSIVIQGNSFSATVFSPVAPGTARGLISSSAADSISAITITDNDFNSNSHRSISLEASTSIGSLLINNNSAQTQGYAFARINYSGTATNSVIFIEKNAIANSSVTNPTSISINGSSDSTNLIKISDNLIQNGTIAFQNTIEAVIVSNKIVNTITGLVGINISGVNLLFHITNNSIETTSAHAITIGNCVSSYICGNRVITTQSFNGIQGATSTMSLCAINNNLHTIKGTGTSSFINVQQITDSTVNDNIANVRTSGTTGRLITAATANTNVITGNRVIAGGATFLSFAVGTNIVANNLST